MWDGPEGESRRPPSSVLCSRRPQRSTLLPSSSSTPDIESKIEEILTVSQTNYLTFHRKKEITSQPFYHGNLLSKAEVKKFMSKSEPGEFLLRNSFSETDSYTFSLMHQTGVKHVKLNCNDGSFYSLKDKQFHSIDQLIVYYSIHAIPNSGDITDVFLSKPIRRKTPTRSPGGKDSSWIYIDVLPSNGSKDTPDKSHPYDSVRDDDDLSVKEEVLRCLELMDRSRREFCDCGLAMDEAELPRGWSVHLSQDPETKGRAYFMSPDGDPVWDLPLHVCLDLSLQQQRLIRRLMQQKEEEGETEQDAATINCVSDDVNEGGGEGRRRGQEGGRAGSERGEVAGGAGIRGIGCGEGGGVGDGGYASSLRVVAVDVMSSSMVNRGDSSGDDAVEDSRL